MRITKLLPLLLLPVLCPTQSKAQQVMKDSLWSDIVGSVFLERSGIPLEASLLTLDVDDQLLLSFDLIDPEESRLRYRIQHCDAKWHIDEMEPYEYISGFEESAIGNSLASFTTLVPYVHYWQQIPGPYNRLLLSGNYILSVFPEDAPDSILFTRRFRVSEDIADMDMFISRPTNGYETDKYQEVNLSIEMKDHSYIDNAPQHLTVFVQQNGRTDLMRELPFHSYSDNQVSYRWKDENIFPGSNSFRYFDISNLRTAMYNVQKVERYGGETFAILRPEENRSTKPFSTNPTLNGGMKINVWDRHDPRIEADYTWVNFSFPMRQPYLNGNIYIVGDLTQWQLDEKSRMEWKPEFQAYTKRLLLKQGYYSYLLIFLPIGESEGKTSVLEGDHCVTPNDYTAYVYFRPAGERYDRLIGVKRVTLQQ